MVLLAKSVRASAAIASVLTAGATGVVLGPASVAGATSTDCGFIQSPLTSYCTFVAGSGAHISAMALSGWEPIDYNWGSAEGYAVYSKGVNGEPFGNALGVSPTFAMNQRHSAGELQVNMNVDGVDHAAYCAFVYEKTVWGPIIVNGGPGVPACVTLD
jgi:hypothetical protein